MLSHPSAPPTSSMVAYLLKSNLLQCNEVAGLYTGHCIYKLAQLCIVCIKLGEEFHVAAFLVLAFILYLAAAKRVFKVVPKLVEPVIRHFEYAAHIALFVLVKEQVGFWCIAVTGALQQPFSL